MSYSPIIGLALKSTHIDIPAQNPSAVGNLTLGSITDASVVTVASNVISLPAGRSYFISGIINAAQSSGTSFEVSLCNLAGVKLSQSKTAYAYYGQGSLVVNVDTYDCNFAAMLLDVTTTAQIVLRKTISNATTTIYKDSASAFFANSGITILYTD